LAEVVDWVGEESACYEVRGTGGDGFAGVRADALGFAGVLSIALARESQIEFDYPVPRGKPGHMVPPI
jgi:hypothetical protein